MDYKQTGTMKKSMVMMAAVAMMVLLGTGAFAQGFSLHFGGAFPQSGLGESRNSDLDGLVLFGDGRYGYAGTGINAGLQWLFGTKVEGLTVLFSVDGFLNGPSSDMKDRFDDIEDEYMDDGDDITLYKPRYINVPVMLGLNYKYNLSENLAVFGEGALGANARFITPFGSTYEEGRYTETVKYHYDPAFTFAYQAGAGVMFNNKYSVSVHYYSLGTARVSGEYRVEWSGDGSGHDKENFRCGKLSCGEVALRLGIHF